VIVLPKLAKILQLFRGVLFLMSMVKFRVVYHPSMIIECNFLNSLRAIYSFLEINEDDPHQDEQEKKGYGVSKTFLSILMSTRWYSSFCM
jgi:hypothetical protein